MVWRPRGVSAHPLYPLATMVTSYLAPVLIEGSLTRWTDISKNYYMRPECAVHLTHRTLRTLTVTLDALPYLLLRPRRPDDVHHPANASRCPQTLSSPASRRSPSCASLVMAESKSTLASGSCPDA